MYYPEELIEEIRAKNDIVEVISGYVRLQKKGNNYFGLCPFHNEKSPSFSVSGAKQMYYCFGCGAGGNVITFLMEYENCSFQEAVKTLAGRAGVDLPQMEYSAKEKQAQNRRAKLLAVNKEAAKYFYYQLRSRQGAIGYEYLKKRQLSDETMQRFGLGWQAQIFKLTGDGDFRQEPQSLRAQLRPHQPERKYHPLRRVYGCDRHAPGGLFPGGSLPGDGLYFRPGRPAEAVCKRSAPVL